MAHRPLLEIHYIVETSGSIRMKIYLSATFMGHDMVEIEGMTSVK